MFVDSHCHLDRLSEHTHGGDIAATLNAARAANVSQFLAISVSLEDMPGLAAIAREHSDVAISAGLHPLHTPVQEPVASDIQEAAEQYGAIAIGETGLDYHYRESMPVAVQYRRFKQHLISCHKLSCPLSCIPGKPRKTRLPCCENISDPRVGGVLHCFTEDLDMAREAVRLGFYISLSGIITFNNAASLRELARQLPLDRLLSETDSPYLAPVPYRGKPNEPAWVVEVAESMSGKRGASASMKWPCKRRPTSFSCLKRPVPDAPAHVKQALAQSGLVSSR